MSAALLQVDGLARRFGGARRLLGGRLPSIHAVQGITLEVHKGETLGIVGESGCGKSTLARMLVGLDRPSDGVIRLGGKEIKSGGRLDGRPLAATIQYVFQDPVSSLNPRKTIRSILMAPMTHLLGLSRERCEDRLKELMDAVNLREEFLERYPHEFSGGQAQRIGIARALAAEPSIIVLGPGRLGPGPGAQPAGRAQDALWLDLCLHQPRSIGRRKHQRSGCGHVLRSGR